MPAEEFVLLRVMRKLGYLFAPRRAYVPPDRPPRPAVVLPERPPPPPAPRPRFSPARKADATLADAKAELKSLLLAPAPGTDFEAALRSTARHLIEGALETPDSLLFQLFHVPSERYAIYAVTHALQCGVACALIGRRFGWEAARIESLVCAALTMNLGMAQLQGEMAAQMEAASNEQLQRVHEHPDRSEAMLRHYGVSDEDWLRAVREHHEKPDGKGYPRGIAATFEASEILRHADGFLAKLKRRATRKAVQPKLAVLDIFVDHSDQRIASAVIKEFGLYPPGVYVRLANGEVGVVIARGAAINQPVVAALISPEGDPRARPGRRDTQDPRYTVVALIDSANILIPVDPVQIYSC